MTELEARVWNFSVAIKIAKDRGESDVVEFLTPLYRSALYKLMRWHWDKGVGASDEAA